MVWVLIAALAMGSCRQSEINSPSRHELTFTLHAGSGSALRASQPEGSMPTTSDAISREKQINGNKLLVLVFNANSKAYIKTIELTGINPNGENKLKLPGTGRYLLYFVANANESLTAQLRNGSGKLATTQSLSEIKVTDHAIDNNLHNFIMLSDGIEVDPQRTSSIRVQLKRLAARIDIVNRFKGLSIEKVIVSNRYDESLLDIGSRNGQSTRSNLKRLPAKEYVLPGNTKDLEAAIYSYENLNTVTDHQLTITLVCKYANKELKSSFVLENTPIKRNHLYRIVVRHNPEDIWDFIEYNVSVAPWEEGTSLDIPSESIINDREDIVLNVKRKAKFDTDETPITNLNEDVYLGRRSNDVTFTVRSTSSTSQLLFSHDSMQRKYPNYTITENESKRRMENGETVQEFVLHAPANLSRIPKRFAVKMVNRVTHALHKELTFTQPARPDLPIEYVSLYNVNTSGNGFASQHTYASNDIYRCYPLRDRLSSKGLKVSGVGDDIYQYDYNINGKEWYTPSMYMWSSILPEEHVYGNHYRVVYGTNYESTSPMLQPNSSYQTGGISERIIWPDGKGGFIDRSFNAMYYNPRAYYSYALRYIDNSPSNLDERNLYLCFFCYRLDSDNNRIIIYCFYLGPDFAVPATPSANSANAYKPFTQWGWDKYAPNGDDKIVRIFTFQDNSYYVTTSVTNRAKIVPGYTYAGRDMPYTAWFANDCLTSCNVLSNLSGGYDIASYLRLFSKEPLMFQTDVIRN